MADPLSAAGVALGGFPLLEPLFRTKLRLRRVFLIDLKVFDAKEMKVVREHREDTYNQYMGLLEKYQHNEVGRTTRPTIQLGSRDHARILITITDIATEMNDVQSIATLLAMGTTTNRISRGGRPLTGGSIEKLRDLVEAACNILENIIDTAKEGNSGAIG